MQKYVTELIGTFFLALTFALASVLGVAGELAPLAIGAVLAVLVYGGGHLSGAHYNPAVTLAIFIRGRCGGRDVAPYLAAQFLGAAAAAGLAKGVFASAVLEAGTSIEQFNPDTPGSTAVVAAELLYTFLLVYVILYVATARKTEGNSYYGLAIGFTVMAATFTIDDISLAGLNPAVSVSLAIEGRLGWADIWMHFFPQVLGAVLAAFTFKGLNPEDQ